MNNNNYNANLERMMIELVVEVRTLTNEVRDIKTKVDGMENIIRNRFPSVTSEHSADHSEVTFQLKVTKYTMNLNRFGFRNIDRVTSSARALYLADGPKKKTTPGIVISITGALMDICQVGYKEGKEMYDRAYNLGKRVKRNILDEEAIRWNDWTSMELEYKRYYCLQLEDLANSESIPLYRCKGQWAAFLIMAQIMRLQNVVPHNEVAMDTREDRYMDRESSLDSLL
ncbi:hypothetical protein BDB01DRAFT_857469 [Pilobolus umbonatus]|nr:hypothetical protein BDB01DRAFT_857469 [Pilobolus umbonatus]